MKITKDTTLGEILKNYKNAEEVLMNFGMHCFHCPMSRMETVEQAASVHDIDIKFMLKKLEIDLVPNKKETAKKTTK